MIKFKKNVPMFLFILAQTAIAIIAGFMVLSLTTEQIIAPNVYVGDINIGGLTKEAASSRLVQYYNEKLQKGALEIKVDEGKLFNIPYSDVDARLDKEATITEACQQGFIYKAIGYFSSQKREFYPVIAFNEGKLRQQLVALTDEIDKEPKNAGIYIKDGKVLKRKEELGIKLNVDNALKRLESEAGKSMGSYITFTSGDGCELQPVSPEFYISDFDGADEIIAQYSTAINQNKYRDSAVLAANAINKVLIRPQDLKRGEKAGTFSFIKYVARQGGMFEKDNDGYNQVASTLYAAVLLSGIDQKAITRTPGRQTSDYIEPGLDAVVNSQGEDLKFTNTLDNLVIIFTDLKDNKLTVSLVSKKKADSLKSSLKTEIVQRFSPTVINLENQQLKKDEKKLITAGKEGIKVNVYRVFLENGKIVKKEFLYYDKYDAVNTVVEIGPDTEWNAEGAK